VRENLTVDGELRLCAAHGNASGHIDGYTTERSSVERPVDGQYTQVTRVLVAATGVGQRPVIQCPVELDVMTTGHVTTQQHVLALDHHLTDRRGVEVETVLTAGVPRQRYRQYTYKVELRSLATAIQMQCIVAHSHSSRSIDRVYKIKILSVHGDDYKKCRI